MRIKPIPKLDGYSITKDGRVYSHYWHRYLKPYKMPTGYLVARLLLNGKASNYYMHRLVATTHIPNPDNKPFVNHKNGDKTDNRVSNLEWCTYLENHLHAEKLGLTHNKRTRPLEYATPNRPKPQQAHKLNWAQVTQIRELHGQYSYNELSKMFGITRSHIANIVRNKAWQV